MKEKMGLIPIRQTASVAAILATTFMLPPHSSIAMRETAPLTHVSISAPRTYHIVLNPVCIQPDCMQLQYRAAGFPRSVPKDSPCSYFCNLGKMRSIIPGILPGYATWFWSSGFYRGGRSYHCHERFYRPSVVTLARQHSTLDRSCSNFVCFSDRSHATGQFVDITKQGPDFMDFSMKRQSPHFV